MDALPLNQRTVSRFVGAADAVNESAMRYDTPTHHMHMHMRIHA